MRKVNFNNLENLKIPDEWAQKALSLPSQLPQKKCIFTLPSFYRRLSFVACCVLVCALSVALFSFMKNDILPQKTPAESIASITTNNTSSYDTATQNIGIIQKPTNSKPTQKIEPTEKMVENTTQPETEPPTPQTQMPTQKSTQKPTQPTAQPEPPQDEIPPTYPPDNPDGPAVDGDGVCVGYVNESLLCGSSTVYCFVIPTNSDIAFPETPDTYTADVSYTGNGSVRISFAGENSSYVERSDYYTFYFYNVNGDVIYEDTMYVTIK